MGLNPTHLGGSFSGAGDVGVEPAEAGTDEAAVEAEVAAAAEAAAEDAAGEVAEEGAALKLE